jgi:hypothetical protein
MAAAVRSICTVVSIAASMLVCSLDAKGGSWHAIVLRGCIDTHTATSSCSHIKYVNLRLPLRARVLTFVTQPSSNPSILAFCSTTPSRRNKLAPTYEMHSRYYSAATHCQQNRQNLCTLCSHCPSPTLEYLSPYTISCHYSQGGHILHPYLSLVCTRNIWTLISRHSVGYLRER